MASCSWEDPNDKTGLEKYEPKKSEIQKKNDFLIGDPYINQQDSTPAGNHMLFVI